MILDSIKLSRQSVILWYEQGRIKELPHRRSY